MANETWPPATDKSEAVQRAVSALVGFENVYERADCALCPKTGIKREDFRDAVSVKEFGISRMCQECQDKIFGVEDTDDCVCEDDCDCEQCPACSVNKESERWLEELKYEDSDEARWADQDRYY